MTKVSSFCVLGMGQRSHGTGGEHWVGGARLPLSDWEAKRHQCPALGLSFPICNTGSFYISHSRVKSLGVHQTCAEPVAEAHGTSKSR